MAPKSSYFSYPCMVCVSLAKWLPVLFIVVVIVWSYYAYVVQLNFLTIESYAEKGAYLLWYHVLLVMFLWSYWQTVFTATGKVPKQFTLPALELHNYLNAETEEVRRDTLETFCRKLNLPVSNRTLTGDIRFCDKCTLVKPDRCHHCSVCGECVLKMDHHCPWVNNCVAFTNYKFFILFLGYGLAYCLFIAATTLQYFIKFWTNQLSTGAGKFHILFLFFVAVMFAISLISLFGYHLFLISRNRSTLETFRGPIFRVTQQTWVQDKEGFSLGAYNNFVEVFGENKKKWFLPIFTSNGNGLVFPLRSPVTIPSPQSTSPQATSYGSTNTSLGDGYSFPQRCIDEDTDDLLGSRQRWAESDEMNGHFLPLTEQERQQISGHPNQTHVV